MNCYFNTPNKEVHFEILIARQEFQEKNEKRERTKIKRKHLRRKSINKQ
jgi:hypothetical protein